MSESGNRYQNIQPPPEFFKIMKDFLNDLLNTFPEYEERITDEENSILNGDVSNNNTCKTKVPVSMYFLTMISKKSFK